MKKQNIKFDFDDILIEPAKQTEINSRFYDVNPKYSNEYVTHYPLFTAPMDSVVDLNNIDEFFLNEIPVVLPRTVKLKEYQKYFYNTKEFYYPLFFSLSLSEFDENYNTGTFNDKLPKYVLIDIANGHIKKLKDIILEVKKKYPNLVLMIGNIANPETYREYAKLDLAQYIRIGIGNGNGCWVDGTLVETKNGLVDIKNIEINDYVLTHKGNYEKVTNKISYINDKILYEINGEVCTEDHELYVVNISDSNKINDDNYENYAYWIEAKNLNEEYHMLLSMDDDV